VHDQPLVDLLHIQHLGRRPVAEDDAGVRVLSTRLGIERRPVEHQLDLVAHRGHPDPLAVPDQAFDGGLGFEFGVAGELGTAGLEQRPVHAQVREPALSCLGIGPGALPLLLH
jgi:hypothetical protein